MKKWQREMAANQESRLLLLDVYFYKYGKSQITFIALQVYTVIKVFISNMLSFYHMAQRKSIWAHECPLPWVKRTASLTQRSVATSVSCRACKQVALTCHKDQPSCGKSTGSKHLKRCCKACWHPESWRDASLSSRGQWWWGGGLCHPGRRLNSLLHHHASISRFHVQKKIIC